MTDKKGLFGRGARTANAMQMKEAAAGMVGCAPVDLAAELRKAGLQGGFVE